MFDIFEPEALVQKQTPTSS